MVLRSNPRAIVRRRALHDVAPGQLSLFVKDKHREVAQQHSIAYPLAWDATETSAQAWRVMWWATDAVVDRRGKIRALGLNPEHVEGVIQKLLNEPALVAE